jgi:chromosome segregation ATPase
MMKEFWIGILTKLARFMVKSMGTKYATLDEQIDVLVGEVDTEALARSSSTVPLLSLLEVVLCCSVHSKLKENCVLQVLQLRKDQQQAMMESIQRLKAKHLKAKTCVASSSVEPSSAILDYKERYIALQKSKDQLSLQLSSVQKSNSVLGDRNAELVSLVTQLESQLNSMSSDYKQTKAQLEGLEEKNQPQEVDLASPLRFVASSKVASEENAQLRLTISAHEKTISTLQQQVSSLSGYVSKVRELEDVVEMLKEKSRSADQLDRTSRKLEARTTELANALAKAKQLEEQVDVITKQANDHEHVAKQVPQLKSKLDQYKAEIVSLHSKMTDASMTQGTRAEDVQVFKDKLQTYAIQIEHQSSIISTLEREKDDLMQVIRSRPVMTSKTSSNNLSALSGSSQPQKASFASETRSTLQQMLGKNKKADAELEKELAATKESMDYLKMDLEDRLDTMERLKEKFQCDYVSTADQLRITKSEMTKMEDMVKTQKETLERVLAENETFSHERSNLKDVVAALEEKNRTIGSQKEVIQFELATLEKKFLDLDSSFAQERAMLTSQVKQLQSKCAQSVEEGRRLTEEVEYVKRELSETMAQLEILSAESATQQDQHQELVSELDQVKHDRAQLEGQMANMEMEHRTLEETLQEFMDRELAAVENSLSLSNEVQNLKTVVESRDAELTAMYVELEKAKVNEEMINVIKALRAQVLNQHKQISAHKEELRAIVASYHKLGMELLQFKIGGIPKPTATTATKSMTTTATGFSYTPPAANKISSCKITPSKRVPLKDKSNNQLAMVQIPTGPCTDANNKSRRMTMAQRALETRPRGPLAAAALAKR